MPRWKCLILLGLLAGASTAAFAQSGGLEVEVRDADSGEAIAGAAVTLESDRGYIAKTRLRSNDAGKALFPVLRAGEGYRLTIAAEGYSSLRMDEQRVRLNMTRTVVAQLSRLLLEKVTITDTTPMVELEDSRTTTRFDDAFIQDLPIEGRFYTNILTLAPGVQDEDGDGNPNVHGGRERDFQAIVGGVSNTDPLTGLRLNNLNLDAIEEIEVVTAGAGVEYGRAQGGYANIIEKQGTNQFEGVFNLVLRSSILDGNGASGLPPSRVPEFSWFQPAVQVSGPIVRDRLWYRFSHEWIDRQDPINTLGGIVTINNETFNNSDVLTWQISRRNRLSLSFLSAPVRIENVGVDSLTPVSATNVFEFDGPTYRLSWTAPYSSSLLVDSVVAYQNANQNILPSVEGVRNDCITGLEFLELANCLNTDSGRRSGSFPTTWRDRRQRLTVKSQATLFGNLFGFSHRLKLGLSIENERYFRFIERRPEINFFVVNVPIQRPNGTTGNQAVGNAQARIFVPSSSDDRAVGTSAAFYVEDQFTPTPNLSVTLGLRVDREVIDAEGYSPLDPGAELASILEEIRPLLDGGASPIELLIAVRSLTPSSFTAHEDLASFIRQFAVAVGISPDETLSRINPTVLQSGNWTKRRLPSNIAIENTNLAPYLALAWDPFGTGKTKIGATVGRHYDKIFLAVPLIELEPASADLNIESTQRGGVFVIDSLCSGACLAPTANTRVVDRGLRTPFQDELTLSFERELMPELALKAVYIDRRFRDQLQDLDLNHLPGDYGYCQRTPTGSVVLLPSSGDGQIRFDPVTGASYVDSDPGIGDGLLDDCIGNLTFGDPIPVAPGVPVSLRQAIQEPDGLPDLYVQNPAWGDFLLVGNFNEADYKAFVLELTRRQYRGWQLNGSYTWSEAIGDAEDFNQVLGNDRSLILEERGFLSYDQRHAVKVNATTVVRWAGGVRLGIAASWESGLPYSSTSLEPLFDAQIPFGNLGLPEPRSRTVYLDGKRNARRNESWWNVDIHVAKELAVKDGIDLRLSADVLNLLNDDSLRVNETLNGRLGAQRRFGRQFQLGLRMLF